MLDKTYNAKEVESRWYRWWEERGFFGARAGSDKPPYTIVIPPPNVTGILHMGHALNNTIQDVLIRWQRMRGREALWVPGTDHAGIATQNVVDRRLRQEGGSRHGIGREKFVERVWQWREQYGNTIARQLRELGSSCDWRRERFTMDEGLSRAVTEVFVRLYEKGLIYRGQYIINWCPACRTALSDEESEHRDVEGRLWHIRYPACAGGKDVVVATTRPETLLGDTAVAVNPRDKRYRGRTGNRLRLPLMNREIPIVEDDFVDPSFGSGAVKVTPAHDPNDFEIGGRHDLERIDVMTDEGLMSAAAGPYAGMDRFECRRQLVRDLEEAGLLVKDEPHVHAIGHCYRCDTMVEPRLSAQWFVRMKPLARPAVKAVREGRVRFVPERWTRVYLEWMENIRDWCISRQIWWGHRIPVFYCDDCGEQWADRGIPESCRQCGAGSIRRDEDVLDTWFSSWLWPFSVFGWPQDTDDLRTFYPTNTLVTAPEIIFFWVARMIMAGCEFMGEAPFSEVYIHGTVRDDSGLKMSKSLGNSIDPLDIVEKYSADALRFSLIMLTATGQDVYISDEKFELGRNFATKIWNAARYLQLQGDTPPDITSALEWDAELLEADDRHILAKLDETIDGVDDNLRQFRFNDAAKILYDFLWNQYCSWYLEYSKPILYAREDPRRPQVLRLLHYVFSSSLRLLHPVMPFITEELWHGMGYCGDNATIMFADWPAAAADEQRAAMGIDDDVISFVDNKHEVIRAARTLMADYNLLPKNGVRFILRPADEGSAERLRQASASMASLAGASAVEIKSGDGEVEGMPSALTPCGTLYMPLEGVLDREVESARLGKQLQKIETDLGKVTRKLENEQFLSRAPDEVVARQRERKRELIDKRDKLKRLLAVLSG